MLRCIPIQQMLMQSYTDIVEDTLLLRIQPQLISQSAVSCTSFYSDRQLQGGKDYFLMKEMAIFKKLNISDP